MTDGRWYRFLAARPELTGINFWRRGGRHAFRALAPGEPFFSKSHYPHNQIVGGGFFSGFVPRRVSIAWELLREGNGAASLAEMRARAQSCLSSTPPPCAGHLFYRAANGVWLTSHVSPVWIRPLEWASKLAFHFRNRETVPVRTNP